MASKTTQSLGVQLTSRNMLTLDELELYELCQLAGVTMEPSSFKIILDLLKMNVSPQAVLQMLKTMCAGRKKQQNMSGDRSGGGAYDTENMPPPRQRPPPKIRQPSGGSGGSRRAESKR